MNAFGGRAPSDSDRANSAHLPPHDHTSWPSAGAQESVPTTLRLKPADLAFADQESNRSQTDLASVLTSYGLTSPGDYCRHMGRRADMTYLRGPQLLRAAAMCNPAALEQVCKTGRIMASWDTQSTRYAQVVPASARPSRQTLPSGATIAVTTRQELGDALRNVFRSPLSTKAARRLATQSPELSASKRLTAAQALIAIALVVSAGTGIYSDPHLGLRGLAVLVSSFFSCVILLRCLVLWTHLRVRAHHHPPRALHDHELPTYTVLVPLFGEANLVPQLLDALCALNYPAALLDIKLLLEEDDQETRAAVRAHRLPGCFEVIVVPACFPQTKPKALNFALPFAHGDLITVFDAEDVPDPEQLRDAAAELAAGPDTLAGVQARLAFYNSNQNWLTRQFALEYASLFDVTLPALASWGLPLPLGGTSNHFRTAIVRKAGGWDPHNVTEDADLGMRLARFGYQVGVLDSSTHEEAVFVLGNWLRQRSRWLKGWMQTWLVHMRSPLRTWRQMGCAGFAVFQVLMGGMVISTLLHPFFVVGVLYGLISGHIWPSDATIGPVSFFALQAAVLLMGYGVMLLIAWRGCRMRGLHGFAASIPAMPLYWLLISLAGWYALWQFLTSPFYWEKTQHGLGQNYTEPGS